MCRSSLKSCLFQTFQLAHPASSSTVSSPSKCHPSASPSASSSGCPQSKTSASGTSPWPASWCPWSSCWTCRARCTCPKAWCSSCLAFGSPQICQGKGRGTIFVAGHPDSLDGWSHANRAVVAAAKLGCRQVDQRRTHRLFWIGVCLHPCFWHQQRWYLDLTRIFIVPGP